jgi:DnaJ-domain-containing protein 1
MAGPDYYAILGVLPSAEDVVIKAAYKALAQRYHPDKYAGSPEEATRRMAEINEAYAVLSDPQRRNEYDAAQSKNGASDGEDVFSDEDEGADPFLVELNAKWNVAVTYFDDLIGIEAWLNKISSRLSFAYKVVLVETRKFDRRVEIAADMEQEFLSRYFGDQPEIVRFARYCVEIGNRAALKDLNRAIVVMGFSAQASTVVSRIRAKCFPLGHRMPWDVEPEVQKSTVNYGVDPLHDDAGASSFGWVVAGSVLIFLGLMAIVSFWATMY